LDEWWKLRDLATICRPTAALKLRISVAVDVRNPLLGHQGCSRVYGPQKGLCEFDWAEKCLERMATVLRQQHGIDCANVPGAGAAGGLGFGLMAFAGATLESGFELFARYSNLEKHIASADIVVTGEGSLDSQSHMGKGVGQIAALCARRRVPCVALAGRIVPAPEHHHAFAHTGALTRITDPKRAQTQAGIFLERLAAEIATRIC
jgi:glycerate kinase